MTPKRAKEITMTKCLFRQVHLDGSYVNPCGETRLGESTVGIDFRLTEFHIVSTPVVARATKLRPRAKFRMVQ